MMTKRMITWSFLDIGKDLKIAVDRRRDIGPGFLVEINVQTQDLPGGLGELHYGLVHIPHL